MMKENKKIATLALSALAAISVLGAVCATTMKFASTSTENDGWMLQGTYTMAFAEDETVEEPVENPTETTPDEGAAPSIAGMEITTTRYKISTDGKYMLMVTAFPMEYLPAMSEIGYTINGDDYSIPKYYTGLSYAAGSSESAQDIFGVENHALIIYEIGAQEGETYDRTQEYTYQAFVRGGETDADVTNSAKRAKKRFEVTVTDVDGATTSTFVTDGKTVAAASLESAAKAAANQEEMNVFYGVYQDQLYTERVTGDLTVTADTPLYAFYSKKLVSGYNLTGGMNSTAANNPGTWYYYRNGMSGATSKPFGEGVKELTYEEGEVTLITSQLNNNLNLRYMPTDKGNSSAFELTFTIQTNVAITLNLTANNGASGYVAKKSVEAGTTEVQYYSSWYGTNPFQVNMEKFVGITDEAPAIVSISNVQFKPFEYTEVTSGLNSTVRSNRNTWYYYIDQTPATTLNFVGIVDNEVIFDLTDMKTTATVKDVFYRLRYEPDFATGTAYVAKANITVSAPAKVQLKDGKTVTFNEAGSKTLTSVSSISDSGDVFFIDIKPMDENADIVIKVNNYEFTPLNSELINSVTDKEELKGSFCDGNATDGKNSTVLKNPNEWRYFFNGEVGATLKPYKVTSGEYAGAIVTEINSVAAGHNVYFRIQPTLDSQGNTINVGDSYTISYKITVNRAVVLTIDTFTAAGTKTFTKTAKLSSSDPYNFGVKSTEIFDETNPLIIIISDVVITKA